MSRAVEASYGTFDQIKDIKQSISYFHDLEESHRRELHSSQIPDPMRVESPIDQNLFRSHLLPSQGEYFQGIGGVPVAEFR